VLYSDLTERNYQATLHAAHTHNISVVHTVLRIDPKTVMSSIYSLITKSVLKEEEAKESWVAHSILVGVFSILSCTLTCYLSRASIHLDNETHGKHDKKQRRTHEMGKNRAEIVEFLALHAVQKIYRPNTA